ncbi:MAG: endonuclease/exonuclease/phosphatase family protein [Bacteroidaceae bacterium]|nr:endonuclease/exonuclease/phosphatase family protein [Bacteroidaceae bacterium]
MKKTLLFLLGFLFYLGSTAQELTVGSYNIRNKNRNDSINGNVWQIRSKAIANQIKWERPDIFGTQECLHHQLVDLEALLSGYRWIGIGRDDGKEAGEYSAIFYKPDRVELLEQGNFWLNETPDRPALGWDAACIRICTWGHFRDRKTKKEFYFLNLHMDHVGVKARSESAKLVMERITKMTNGGKKLAVLTGDFNVPQTNELYSLFTQSGVLKDCYTCAKDRFAETGTYNSFDPKTYTTERIDHIFVTPSTSVEAFAVLTSGYWTKDTNNQISRRTLSDHYPIFARIKF